MKSTILHSSSLVPHPLFFVSCQYNIALPYRPGLSVDSKLCSWNFEIKIVIIRTLVAISIHMDRLSLLCFQKALNGHRGCCGGLC